MSTPKKCPECNGRCKVLRSQDGRTLHEVPLGTLMFWVDCPTCETLKETA